MNPTIETSPKITLSDISQNLLEAWHNTRSKGKARGSDGQSFDDFEADLDQNLARLEQDLRCGSYTPRPAQRVWQLKDTGGERGITVFCVRDRVALSAIRKALARVLPTSNASFAYREGYGAVRAAHRLLEHRKAGREWVVRSDIKDFFDSIPHQTLLGYLRDYVDTDLLSLLEVILQTPIKDGLALHIPERGIAQGSSISPLLSNFYLQGFDAAVNTEGRALVRYADDFVISANSVTVAATGLEVAKQSLAALGLALNEHKTQIVSFEQGFDFLGFHFDALTVRISQKSLLEFKTHLEALLFTRMEQFDPSGVKRANDLIIGWRNYYSLGDVKKDYADLEQWMRDRFGSKSRMLESLSPERQIPKAPVLGGYTRPRRSEPEPKATPSPKKNQTGLYAHVKQDSNGTPTTIKRYKAILSIENLEPLKPSPMLEQIYAELTKTALFHRANTACRWKTPQAADAASTLTRAMMGQGDFRAAFEHYEAALLAHSLEDARAAKGSLRARLERTAWAALLEVGLDIGTDTRQPPKLAVLLSDAFECLIADIALLAAMKTGELEKPIPHFERALKYQPAYRRPNDISPFKNMPWYVVLQHEAQAIKDTLEQKTSSYRAFKFGLAENP